jgi:protein-glutamine gamma-glutamyltransferase
MQRAASMSFERPLRIAIAAMILLATMLLGIGDRTATLTLFSLVAVLVSAYFTDATRRFCLSQSAANWVALAIVAGAMINALQLDRHGQMVAVANLQSYLQYVLLFQPKTPRAYWQLALLSLGQVAIASTLVPGPTFGLLLLAYLLAGTATFLLLLLESESTRLTTRPAQLVTQTTVAPATSARTPGRSKPVLVGKSAPASDALGKGLIEQAVLICVSSLLVTSVLFFFLPRWNISNRQVASNEPLRSVGFSKKVTLGELGEVVNNSNLVMRIKFLRAHSGKPFQLLKEPLLRGTVVTHYENGAWTQTGTGSADEVPTEIKSPFVRQHITIEPLDVPEMFCVFPVFALPGWDYSRVRVDAHGEELVRQEDARSEQLEFEIGTNGIFEERQRHFLPCESPLNGPRRRELLQMPEPHSGQTDPFPGLRDIGARVLREANVDPKDHQTAARKLDEYLHASGDYSYSLDAQNRDPALDPLEDFVTRHRVGHCEYFAGALVMLLRSQGIPARMAIGFKGGEWNPPGQYYQVQQLHAHAWVEVYLDAEHLPREEFASDDAPPEAAWMLFDPTEGVQQGVLLAQQDGFFVRARQYLDYSRVLWTNYVVGLNAKRQRQVFYEPLVQGVSAAVDNLTSAEVWQSRMRVVAKSPVGAFWEWYRRHWFSWRGGMVAAGFSFIVSALYLACRWAVGALGRRGFGRARLGDSPPVLEIYRRLETALNHLGVKRQPNQTAYEFAQAAGGDLAENIELRRLAPLPRRIVESFYRVRFGGRTLDNLEANAVEQALVELELALARLR